MKLYLKQKVFSWGDKFSVYNEAGDPVYFVEGEVFSLGKKLHVYDTAGNEVVFIQQKLLSFYPTYFINVMGKNVASVIRRPRFFKSYYEVTNFGWEVDGDFWSHDYTIFYGDKTVATIFKEWMSWGDAYAIDFKEGVRELDVLSVALIIDANLEQDENNR